MTTQIQYLKNAWYAAALSSEVEGQALFSRKILGISVLIYRLEESGEPVAIQDRCPHRFAPLSIGKRCGNRVKCVYHGLEFDQQGKCTHNPHGNGHIPKAAQVRQFSIVERFGFLWIWMGEEKADLSRLPDYSPLDDGHENGVGYTYMKLNSNYELMIDNVMDLSHIDHIHGEIISTRGKLSPVTPKIKDEDRTVNARWEWEQQPAMMIFAPFLEEPEKEANHYFDITWAPPANIQLSVGAVQGGKGFDEAVSQYDLHTCTPEDEFSTHYFFATRRNHVEEDAEYNEQKIKGMHDAFELEDGPVIQAVQDEMQTSDFFSLNPVLMSNDAAAFRVRKKLQRLIAEEQVTDDPMDTEPSNSHRESTRIG